MIGIHININSDNLYDLVFSSLSNSFETSKGFGADCPFCFAESTTGKIRFLVFADHQAKEVTGFNCYVCNRKGAGSRVRALYRELGINIFSTSLLGKNKGSLFTPAKQNKEKDSSPKWSITQMFGGKSVVKDLEIQWPPSWVSRDKELVDLAVAYMNKRGIDNPESFIEKYDLEISYVIDRAQSGERQYLSWFPSILAPAVDKDGNVVGWSARRIDSGLSLSSSEANDKKLFNGTKTFSMVGDGWKVCSLFGLREIRSEYPVTIVEGLFDALATPNSIALLGKRLSSEHAKLIGETGSKLFIIAVDPDVKDRDQSNIIVSLKLAAPGSQVIPIDLTSESDLTSDPSERGRKEMIRLIKKTSEKYFQSIKK